MFNVFSLVIDSDTDTLVTAESLFNSPSESLERLNIPLLAYDGLNSSSSVSRNATSRRHSTDSSSSGSSDTLVDNMSMVSIASSCATLVSEGGDAYKCARSEFVFRRNPKKGNNSSDAALKCR